MSEDLETTLRRMTETKVNRRGFLAAAGLTGAAAAIAACSTGTGGSPAASTGGSPAAVPSGAPSAAPSAAPADSFPAAGPIEKELFMYNWSEYISLANIEAYKAKYGITKFQYDIYDSNDVLLAKLQGGATGYDIASPTKPRIAIPASFCLMRPNSAIALPNWRRSFAYFTE